MKWLILAVFLVLAVLGVRWQMNTTKISYVNGLDQYAHLPNQEFILLTDCYVFAWHERIATAHPLLGANLPAAATSLAALPPEVRASNVGQPFPLVRIMDVIPRGTRFRVLSVRREESRKTGTFISYEISFLDDIDRPYKRVDLRPILLPVARPGDAPAIDPVIAVPWIKR